MRAEADPERYFGGGPVHAKLLGSVSSELEDILAAFANLVAAHEASREEPEGEEDPENFRCTDCVDCRACRFCTSCERCADCTYCDACSDCEGCTQSRELIACADCSQSNLSAYCERSSYLTLCLDCEGCVQCFGCVGMTDAEFCILNEKYKRSAYFKKVAQLRKLLDAKLTEGWMPPWIEGAEPEEEPLPPPPPIETVAPREPEPEPEPEPEDEPEPELEPYEEPERAATPTSPAQPELYIEPEPASPEPGAPVVTPVAPTEPLRAAEPRTGVATPNRIDPYAERTSLLPDTGPAPLEHTGSWPPVDSRSARSMDRESRGRESWEELFEPDELPPPRAQPPATLEPVVDAVSKRFTTTAPPEPEPEPEQEPQPTRSGPRWGQATSASSRFERRTPAAPSHRPPARDADAPAPEPDTREQGGPPAGFLGEIPDPPSSPEVTGGLRIAKRPRRRR